MLTAVPENLKLKH